LGPEADGVESRGDAASDLLHLLVGHHECRDAGATLSGERTQASDVAFGDGDVIAAGGQANSKEVHQSKK
jgi:hypothetical protein